MSEKIKDFSHLRDDLLKALDKFPEALRNINLFGHWSAKNVVAHLSGWDSYTVQCLINLKKGKFSKWGDDVDKFNSKSVKERQECDWSQTLLEFTAISKRLLDEYSSLSEEQFHQKIYKSHPETATDYLSIDLQHYREHLAQIKEKINNY